MLAQVLVVGICVLVRAKLNWIKWLIKMHSSDLSLRDALSPVLIHNSHMCQEPLSSMTALEHTPSIPKSSSFWLHMPVPNDRRLLAAS
jgi:hypothetical protein